MNAALWLPLALAVAGCATARARGPHEITLEGKADRFVVHDGTELFTEFIFHNDPKPILYPLLAPGGVAVTRDWPMVESSDEPHDHPHHQSLWFAHGSVNGHDFWSSPNGEKIVHATSAGQYLEDGAEIVSVHLWQIEGGHTLCRERRRMRFSAAEDGRRIDFTFELAPAAEALVFGDTKEGTFALRLAPSLALTGDGAQGHALNSAGERDADCWGKRAAWIEYSGPVEGHVVGVALLEHPANFRHPTWWHARDYGLVAANPFGVHDFEQKPAGTGDFTLAPGETLTLRYRLWLHEGTADAAALAREFERYAAQPIPK